MKRLISAFALLAVLAGGAPSWALPIDSNTKLLLQHNAPSSGGNVKAIKLDGSGDYLTVPDHADWDFGSGSYTVEGFFRFNSTGVGHGLISRNDGSGSSGFQLEWTSGGGGLLAFNTAGAAAIQRAFTPVVGKWYHFAVVRSTSTMYMFINGVQQGSTESDSDNISGTDSVYIGRFSSGIRDFDGDLKYVRISNTARYTADFTPASSFASDSNTKLLLAGEESLHATTFTDSGNTGHTVTTNGGAIIALSADFKESIYTDTELTPKSPITQVGGVKQIGYKSSQTALFFDGASHIAVPDHADWDLGTGDFTMEAKVMTLSSPSAQTIGCLNDTASGVEFSLQSSTNIRVFVAGTQYNFTTPTLMANTFYDVAVSRSGTSLRAFLNGKQVGSTETSSGSISSTTGVWVGARTDSSNYLTGWIKGFRISNSARYTADYTPTDTPFTSDSNTKLLLHGNTSATAPLSPWVMLDGTGDYMTIPDAAWQDFGTGEWTVEGNIRWYSVAGSTLLTVGTSTNGIRLAAYDTGGTAGFHTYVVNTEYQGSPGFTPVNGRSYHFAAVRDGNTLRMFLDGVSYGTADITAKNITGLTQGVTIGGDNGAGFLVNGWIRNVRISNIARYTADFTPPTSAFTSDANTMFLMHGNEANGSTTFTDSSSNAATITTNGDAKIDFQEDYRSNVITDSGNTGHKPYSPPAGRAKVDFLSPFGYGATFMDGSGDYLTAPDSTDWDLGTGDFTLEGFYRFSSVGSSQALIEFGNSGSTGVGIKYNQASGQLRLDINGATVLNPSFSPIVNNWYHFSASRASGTARLFINGSLKSNSADSSNVSGSSDGVYLGYNVPGTGYFYGMTDNNRISDVARYTATFDPADSDFSSGRRRSAIMF